MGILDWLGLRSAPVSEPLPGVIPPSRNTSRAVSLDQSLALPAAFRAIVILATAVSQLDLDVERGDTVIDAPNWILKPDPSTTAGSFWKRTVIGLAGTGNAYWRLHRDPAGGVAGLTVLNPNAVSISYDDHGRKRYHYAANGHRSGPTTFNEADVRHLRYLEIPGHVLGLGPIQACRAAIGGYLDLGRWADQWFTDSGVPTGVLTTDQHLMPADADQLRTRWHTTQAKRDVAVLGRGLTYEPILIKPADAQFLESQNFSVTDIARLFGIPANYLLAQVSGSNLTYANIESVGIDFARLTLMTYLTEIEDHLSDLLPGRQRARWNLDSYLRPDSKTRAEIHRLYLDAGVRTGNEVRRDEHWTPLDGLDSPAPRRAITTPTP